MAFSVYRRNSYGIYTISAPAVLAGRPVSQAITPGVAAVLPPANRDPGGVVAMLNDPATGLPSTAEFADGKYHAGLSLDYIGQPHLAAGVDSWGTFIGGGASAFWSDLLGNHNLATVFEVNGGYKDITVAAAYTNLTKRLNWGVIGQQVPYLSGGIIPSVGVINGTTAYVEQLVLYRQTNRALSGLAAFAFDRVRRLEFQAGVTNITYEQEIRTKAWEMLPGFIVTNNQLVDSTETISTDPALNLAIGSSAYVFDNSLFGATSPILGQRYRLEVSPMLGSLTVFQVLADYRKYLMPVRPFTLAGRLVHTARYGPDGDSPRLYPMYLGYQTIVRGYPQGSFNVALECPVNTGSCPSFDRLLGSRIAVANAELRFPLLGALGVGSGYYGGFPIEMAFFFDAGVAWTGTEGLWFLDGGTRKPVTSVGSALRINLLGFAVVELSLARPLSRPEGGWVWQFGFAPGF